MRPVILCTLALIMLARAGETKLLYTVGGGRGGGAGRRGGGTGGSTKRFNLSRALIISHLLPDRSKPSGAHRVIRIDHTRARSQRKGEKGQERERRGLARAFLSYFSLALMLG